MLLPEEDPNTDYIMVATGTGIAHTVDSFVVCSRRTLPLLKHTRVKHGCFWVLLTVTHFYTMTSFKMLRRKVFELITLFLVNKTTSREEKCTSKTRSKNTLTRFLKSLKTVHTSTSVV